MTNLVSLRVTLTDDNVQQMLDQILLVLCPAPTDPNPELANSLHLALDMYGIPVPAVEDCQVCQNWVDVLVLEFFGVPRQFSLSALPLAARSEFYKHFLAYVQRTLVHSPVHTVITMGLLAPATYVPARLPRTICVVFCDAEPVVTHWFGDKDSEPVFIGHTPRTLQTLPQSVLWYALFPHSFSEIH